jgi:hypothetical protein
MHLVGYLYEEQIPVSVIYYCHFLVPFLTTTNQFYSSIKHTHTHTHVHCNQYNVTN